MKKHFSKQLYTFLGSGIALILYVNFVVPDIEQPASILGFFLSSGVFIYAFFWLISSWKLSRYSPALLSGILTLASLYLVAMRTINSLDWADLVIVVVVLTLMIQLLIVQKKQ